jgi:outer membrane receptor protein involved in Fe transport
VQAYGLAYELDLFSDFTLFARDRVHGDEIEQTDDRVMLGGQATYKRLHHHGKVAGLVTAGLQVRHDDTVAGLWHAAQRARLADCFDNPNPCNRGDNRVLDLSAYVEDDVSIGARLRLLGGVRFDQYAWDVDDLDPDTMGTAGTIGGRARQAIVSPKLSAIVRVSDHVETFVNGGFGFHSNDARASVASHGEGALARAIGAEAGVRVAPQEGLHASFDVWYLHLASEQVWSGDTGGTEPSDPTRRYGIDVELAWEAAPWRSVDPQHPLGPPPLVSNHCKRSVL